MKFFLALLASIFYLSPWLVCASEALILHVNGAEPVVEVKLPANPTTGYQWRLKQYNQALLQLQSQRYIRSNSKLMGAGGESIFIFSRRPGQIAPKQTQLLFSYLRPWEPSSADDKAVIIKFD
jgi:inhibitor of cysteine peptidase